MSTDRSPPPRPWPDSSLVIAYGLGINSTAMLVEFAQRGIRPDRILFADTSGEKPETYAYLDCVYCPQRCDSVRNYAYIRRKSLSGGKSAQDSGHYRLSRLASRPAWWIR
jgi:hypothetical protein